MEHILAEAGAHIVPHLDHASVLALAQTCRDVHRTTHESVMTAIRVEKASWATRPCYVPDCVAALIADIGPPVDVGPRVTSIHDVSMFFSDNALVHFVHRTPTYTIEWSGSYFRDTRSIVYDGVYDVQCHRHDTLSDAFEPSRVVDALMRTVTATTRSVVHVRRRDRVLALLLDRDRVVVSRLF